MELQGEGGGCVGSASKISGWLHQSAGELSAYCVRGGGGLGGPLHSPVNPHSQVR